MKIYKTSSMAVLLILLAGCVFPAMKSGDQITFGEHYAILDVLPGNLEGFTYENSATYPSPLGYSLRFRNDISSLTYSDIYIYPVPKSATGYRHEEIVSEVTNGALLEIAYAKKVGAYSEFNVIGEDKFTLLGKLVTRVDMSLVKDNLVVYSLLYVTESNGKIIKARMTMPDNESNRSSDLWNKFVTRTFSIILDNIDKA